MRTEAGPAIAELRAGLSCGDHAAAQRFWAMVESTGAPLVEQASEPSQRLVTFLWRDDGATDRVVVVGGPALWDPIDADLMERVTGTDVWYATYLVDADLACSYQLSPNDSLQPADAVTDWAARESTFCVDPLNPNRIDWPANPEDPAMPAHESSWLVLPDAPVPVEGPPDAARGVTTEHRFASAVLGNTRPVWVHESLRTADEPAPALLVLLDGWVWAQVLPVADLVDALRVREECGPVTVLMVDSLDEETRCRELECHPPFLTFLRDELLPWVRARWPVTDDRARTAIAGQSLGGLTAVFTLSEEPNPFGLLISQSGSFWWPRDGDDRPTEWLTTHLRPASGPTRVRLDVGSLEGADMVPTNRRMRDALLAAGYDVTYAEPHGGHDWFRWWLGLPAALTALAPVSA